MRDFQCFHNPREGCKGVVEMTKERLTPEDVTDMMETNTEPTLGEVNECDGCGPELCEEHAVDMREMPDVDLTEIVSWYDGKAQDND